MQLEKWSSAVEIYQISIEIRPNFYWNQYSLGCCLLKISRYEEAIVAYERAIKIEPDLYFAYHNLGNTFLS